MLTISATASVGLKLSVDDEPLLLVKSITCPVVHVCVLQQSNEFKLKIYSNQGCYKFCLDLIHIEDKIK